MKLDINQKGSCLCEAFNTTCNRVVQIRREASEILKRAGTLGEAVDIANDAGRTNNEKALFIYLVGEEVGKFKRDEPSIENQGNTSEEIIKILKSVIENS